MPLPALPALASLFGRALPAMIGEGELLTGLVSRSGVVANAGVAEGSAAAGAARGGSGLSSMLGDLLSGGLSGNSKSSPKRETEEEKDDRIKRRRHVPSAADLFGYRPEQAKSPAVAAGSASNSTFVRPNANELGTGAAQDADAPDRIKRTKMQDEAIRPLDKLAGAFKKITGPLGSQFNLWLKVNTGLYAGSKALETFVWGISESNRGLGKWNGQIAASFAQLDIADMRREIQTADATFGSTTSLNTALSELLNEVQPIREGVGTAVNTMGIIAAKVSQGLAIGVKILTFLPIFAAGMREIEKLLGPDGKPVDTDPLAEFMHGFRNPAGGRPGPMMPPVPIGPRDPLPPIVPREPLPPIP
jgi:hypothetical protein